MTRLADGNRVNSHASNSVTSPARDRASRNPTIHQLEPYLVSRWRIPDYLQDIAFLKSLPRVLRSSCDTEVTPTPGDVPSKSKQFYPDPNRDRWQPNEFYTYLTQSFALGAMSRVFWDIGMPALAFWKAKGRAPRTAGDHHALYVRYQHNDRKPFGQRVMYLRGQRVEPPPHQSWVEFGRHAALQDHGRAIVIYRPRLDYLTSYGLVPGVPSRASFDGDLAVTSLQALACFYREDLSPRGFFIGAAPVKSFPANVGRGQWVFVDDGETWIAVRPLEATDLGGANPPRLITGDRHVFLQVDNLRSPEPVQLRFAQLMQCRGGFLMAVGDRTDYPSFAAFRAEIAASKISESVEGTLERVEWTAGRKTLRLGWDFFKEQYLERSIDSATVEPWPRFSSPEYQQALVSARLGDVTVTTRNNPQTPVWLLADRSSNTFVVYQPNPNRFAPLDFHSPFARINANHFPFGKLVLRAKAEDSPHLEIDAEYPVVPTVDFTLKISGAKRLSSTINGQPAALCTKEEQGRWSVSPYPTP